MSAARENFGRNKLILARLVEAFVVDLMAEATWRAHPGRQILHGGDSVQDLVLVRCAYMHATGHLDGLKLSCRQQQEEEEEEDKRPEGSAAYGFLSGRSIWSKKEEPAESQARIVR